LRQKLVRATAAASPDDVITTTIYLHDVIIIVHLYHGHASVGTRWTSYLVKVAHDVTSYLVTWVVVGPVGRPSAPVPPSTSL